jgi:hypothetical protein
MIMNKEDVYKYYGWNPSDGDYRTPESEMEKEKNGFSFFAIRFYHKFLRIVTLRFF